MIRIAIDGPGGAGKSTLAKRISEELGIVYMDTGALYRTVGFYMLSSGVNTADVKEVARRLPEVSLSLAFEGGKQTVLLNGEDVGDRIRTQECSMAASDVSKIPEVRAFLLSLQKEFAERNSVVMDGRDIGTVIIPDAEVKIFLTASPEARADRRYKELIAKGVDTTPEKVLAELSARDKQDAERDIAPCVPAADAIRFDNSRYDLDGTVNAAMKIIRKAQKKADFRKRWGSRTYRALFVPLSPFFRFIFNVHLHGKENIPTEGGVIACSNHLGIRDVMCIAAVFPRQVRFLAKKEWFSKPVLAPIIRKLGAISLDRSGGDVGALKNAVNAAKSGSAVVIFPQGHRYPCVNPAKTPVKNGVGLIEYHAKVPVLPICLKTKGEKYGFFQRIDLYVGAPIAYEDFGFDHGGYDEYRSATEKIFTEVCALGDYGPLQKPEDGGEKQP